MLPKLSVISISRHALYSYTPNFKNFCQLQFVSVIFGIFISENLIRKCVPNIPGQKVLLKFPISIYFTKARVSNWAHANEKCELGATTWHFDANWMQHGVNFRRKKDTWGGVFIVGVVYLTSMRLMDRWSCFMVPFFSKITSIFSKTTALYQKLCIVFFWKVTKLLQNFLENYVFWCFYWELCISQVNKFKFSTIPVSKNIGQNCGRFTNSRL